jgi:hypothetical protein
MMDFAHLLTHSFICSSGQILSYQLSKSVEFFKSANFYTQTDGHDEPILSLFLVGLKRQEGSDEDLLWVLRVGVGAARRNIMTNKLIGFIILKMSWPSLPLLCL